MRKWYFTAGVAVLVVLLAGTFGVRAADNNSQLFTPARYALLAAPVDVAMIQGAGSAGIGHTRQALFKVDTVTGDVWVLQMTIMGGNDPKVNTANWHHVRQPGRGNAASNGDQLQW